MKTNKIKTLLLAVGLLMISALFIQAKSPPGYTSTTLSPKVALEESYIIGSFTGKSAWIDNSLIAAVNSLITSQDLSRAININPIPVGKNTNTLQTCKILFPTGIGLETLAHINIYKISNRANQEIKQMPSGNFGFKEPG